MRCSAGGMNGPEIKRRRVALRMTQKELAARVRKLSGRSFSQQALGKLEASDQAESRLMHYIIQVLDSEERKEPAAQEEAKNPAPAATHPTKR